MLTWDGRIAWSPRWRVPSCFGHVLSIHTSHWLCVYIWHTLRGRSSPGGQCVDCVSLLLQFVACNSFSYHCMLALLAPRLPQSFTPVTAIVSWVRIILARTIKTTTLSASHQHWTWQPRKTVGQASYAENCLQMLLADTMFCLAR